MINGVAWNGFGRRLEIVTIVLAVVWGYKGVDTTLDTLKVQWMPIALLTEWRDSLVAVESCLPTYISAALVIIWKTYFSRLGQIVGSCSNCSWLSSGIYGGPISVIFPHTACDPPCPPSEGQGRPSIVGKTLCGTREATLVWLAWYAVAEMCRTPYEAEVRLLQG